MKAFMSKEDEDTVILMISLVCNQIWPVLKFEAPMWMGPRTPVTRIPYDISMCCYIHRLSLLICMLWWHGQKKLYQGKRLAIVKDLGVQRGKLVHCFLRGLGACSPRRINLLRLDLVAFCTIFRLHDLTRARLAVNAGPECLLFYPM